MSLQSTYNSVKGVIVDNLESMGVDASSSDGLTTLANKILDIEPSIGGLDLDTAVTLSVSSSTVVIGGSITCTATLTAEYDDETLVDVDLHGVLQNATIKLYEGSTLMTSATTNANGVATLTYTPMSIGTKTIKVVFDGTENFNDCESATQTITVTQPTVGDVEITSTKDILSYADSDSADITVTVYDDGASALPIEGVSVTIKVDGTTVKTADTDSSGEVSYTYTSAGAGDVTISAECMSSSGTYSIEDCKVYDTLTTNKNRFIGNPSNVNYTSDGYGLTANTNWTPTYYNYEMSQDMSIEFDFNSTTEDRTSATTGYYSIMTSLKNTIGGADLFQVYFGKNNVYDYTHSTKYAQSIDVTHIKYKITNNTVEIYANDSLVCTQSVSGSTFYWYWWSGGNRIFRIKNLKIKPL